MDSKHTQLSANSKKLQIFRLQQKLKLVVFCSIFLLPLAMTGVWYVKFKSANGKPSSIPVAIDGITPTVDDQLEQTETLEENPSNSNIEDSQSVAGGPGYGSGNVPSGSSPAPASSTNTMPAGVTTAINSIETNGIKGNPYVADTIDSNQLPSGTTIKFDRNSWSSGSATSGTVKATLNVSGQSYNGTITFNNVGNNVWKATSYSLS